MKQFRKELIEWAGTIGIAIIIAIAINLFGGLAIVEGLSMDTTLHDKDVLLRIAFHSNAPERGDIIAFKSDIPHPCKVFQAIGLKKVLVKRVIGIAGDRIEIKDGEVFRNSKKITEPYIHGAITSVDTNIVVPEGRLFVLGDNRKISHDSRYSDIGCVDIKKVLGKTNIRIFPISRFGEVDMNNR